MTSEDPRAICEAVQAALPSLMQGSLRIWGQWFGRPYDNVHKMVGCSATEDYLRLSFIEDEILTIWNPSGIVLSSKKFEVLDATRVRWDWHSYGEPKIPKYFLHEDYTRRGDRAELISNVYWYTPPKEVVISGPAAELL